MKVRAFVPAVELSDLADAKALLELAPEIRPGGERPGGERIDVACCVAAYWYARGWLCLLWRAWFRGNRPHAVPDRDANWVHTVVRLCGRGEQVAWQLADVLHSRAAMLSAVVPELTARELARDDQRGACDHAEAYADQMPPA